MQTKTSSLVAAFASVCLNIYKRKTRSSNPTHREPTQPHLIEKLWNRRKLTCLVSIIDERGGSDADVKAMIGKARAAFLQLKTTRNSK
ncbi:unnamed protein product [Schistosoma mattheei]|uniref:Uncharacterized protein n=1 Tax=Schistosoma mattheei TaxID=31246 RepID=A0A183PQJ8_9TREM|nr:unnamed protein product [Schistosoma mattheei]